MRVRNKIEPKNIAVKPMLNKNTPPFASEKVRSRNIVKSSAGDTTRAERTTNAASVREVAALGITNQRETAIIWDRATGRPIHNAIVWQDRRTAGICARLRREGHERMISARTKARKARNFAEADRIRDELVSRGVALKDSKDGTTWEIAR